MAFPLSPLPTFAELQLGGAWVDVTSDVRATDGTSGISTSRGISSSGGAVADRGTCAVTLTNTAGKYSTRNPRSPYYGQLRRNTPLRTGVMASWSWLELPYDTSVTATTPDNAALHITGDLDVRVDLELANWRDINQITACGRWDDVSNCSWALTLVAGHATLVWTTGGTSSTDRFADSAQLPVASGWGRLAIRAALDVNNGASGHAVTWYTAPTLAGPWTQLGTPQGDPNHPGVTSLFAGTRLLEVGTVTGQWSGEIVPTTYRVYGAEVRNSSGTVVAAPDFRSLTSGATTWTDSAGRVWTAPAGSITNRLERFVGEVSSWPPSWDTGGFDVTAPITANGILQRLGQGQQPLDSALKRGLTVDSSLRAYWPMEDPAGATMAASALSGGAPLHLNDVTFASDTSLAGSGALPVLAGAATMSGTVLPGASGDWAVTMLVNLASLPAGFEQLLAVNVKGGIATQVLLLVDITSVRVQAFNGDTSLGTADISASGFTSGWQVIQLHTFISGGNVGFYVVAAGAAATFSVAGGPGSVASVSAAWSADLTGMAIGHLTVGSTTSGAYLELANGLPGFDTPDRITRIGSDAGIPVSVIGVEDESETLGPEPHDTALGVITTSAAADEGLLYEAREFVGLRYRTLAAMCSQPSALDLPYTADPQPLLAPLTPTDDDQALRNQWTVERTDGSSSTYTAVDGSLTPAMVGLYSDSATLNLVSDDRTLIHAGWRVYLGTWDEARYPSVIIELAKDPDLIEAVSRIDTGSRIRITGDLPDWLPPESIDLLVLGYSETLAQFSWQVTFACVPYGPYRNLGVIGDAVYDRADTAGCVLATGVTSTATSWSVTTTGLARWIDSATYGTEFPLDWMVGGERVTVTAITGTGLTQTATVTRSVNSITKSQTAGTPIALADPTYVALAGDAL